MWRCGSGGTTHNPALTTPSSDAPLPPRGVRNIRKASTTFADSAYLEEESMFVSKIWDGTSETTRPNIQFVFMYSYLYCGALSSPMNPGLVFWRESSCFTGARARMDARRATLEGARTQWIRQDSLAGSGILLGPHPSILTPCLPFQYLCGCPQILGRAYRNRSEQNKRYHARINRSVRTRT